MTLAGYPREDLYPSDTLYPGVPQPHPEPGSPIVLQAGELIVKMGETTWSI